jgi:broad specificity phosphatase PhoE
MCAPAAMELQETLDESEAVHGGDCALSATGERQLRFRLRTKPADLQRLAPHVVYCSPLQRALRTALSAYPARPIIVDTRLREIGTCTGLKGEELRAFVAASTPQRTAKVDTTRVPDAAWWGDKDQGAAAVRVQRFLKEVHQKTSKGKIVAIVAHCGLFKAMAGSAKPFPKIWGNPRGFPMNMKPYFAVVDDTTPKILKVMPATSGAATLILLRHAHSRAQAAISLQKKIGKFTLSPNKTVAAARALDRQIKKFCTTARG